MSFNTNKNSNPNTDQEQNLNTNINRQCIRQRIHPEHLDVYYVLDIQQYRSVYYMQQFQSIRNQISHEYSLQKSQNYIQIWNERQTQKIKKNLESIQEKIVQCFLVYLTYHQSHLIEAYYQDNRTEFAPIKNQSYQNQKEQTTVDQQQSKKVSTKNCINSKNIQKSHVSVKTKKAPKLRKFSYVNSDHLTVTLVIAYKKSIVLFKKHKIYPIFSAPSIRINSIMTHLNVRYKSFFLMNVLKFYQRIRADKFQQQKPNEYYLQKQQQSFPSLPPSDALIKLQKLKILRTKALKKYHQRFHEQSSHLYHQALMQISKIKSEKFVPSIEHEISELNFVLENECGVVEYYRRNFQQSKRHFKKCLDQKKRDMSRQGEEVKGWPIFQIMMRNFVLCLKQLALPPQISIANIFYELGTLYHNRKCFEQSDECLDFTLRTAKTVMKDKEKQLEDWASYVSVMKQWREVKKTLGETETVMKMLD